jgi:triosephosphate isomerase
MGRKKLLVGNWKMNKTILEAEVFAKASLDLSAFAEQREIEIGVCPTFLGLKTVKEINPKLIVGAQNCSEFDYGAYTGEIAIPMLKEIGINWCLVGHSERRSYYGETNEHCNAKIKALIAADMVPLYCVGETLDQFEKGETKAVVEEQIRIGLSGLSADDVRNLVVAYEPVWSIGTGKNASKEIAQDVCGYIRKLLRASFGENAEKIRILYGGSVKPVNVKEYLSEPDIDGALVGGASLAVESFRELIANIGE